MLRCTPLLLSSLLLLGGAPVRSAEPKTPPAPVLVVGHRNPDTDSIIAAIGVARLKTRQGIPASAVSTGPVNPETQFVLDTFHLQAPPVATTVAGRQVILVDHSDAPQAPVDLAKAELIGLVDHHKLGGLSTDKPLEGWLAPVGSSCTIVARMWTSAGVAIPKDLAGGLLCAILSDTVIFKSPTTTPEDKATAARLAKIAGVKDMKALGLKLFEAKSQVKGVPAADLLKRDFKPFTMSGVKVGVAQLEVVDLAILTPLKADLQKAMVALKGEGYHTLLFMLTDVMAEGTDLLVLTDDQALVEGALDLKLKAGSVWLPGVMSRKKQIIPKLEKAFKPKA